jgi:hypothetical protein
MGVKVVQKVYMRRRAQNGEKGERKKAKGERKILRP